MKTFSRWMCATLFLPCLLTAGNAQSKTNDSGIHIGVDVLTPVEGTAFRPYLLALMSELKQHYAELVATSGSGAVRNQGEVSVDLSIARDGSLVALHLDPASQGSALSKTVWAVTRDAGYSALPAGMTAGNLTLRVHFLAD